MPVLRSGLVVNLQAAPNVAVPVGPAAPAAPAAPPAGFPTWKSYHLCEGMKIALDYLNLPVPPAGVAYRNGGVWHRNKKSAKGYGKRARDWAIKCKSCPILSPFFTLARSSSVLLTQATTGYKLSAGTPYSATATPGLAPLNAAARAAPRYKFRARDITNDNAQILPARSLSILYPSLWTLGPGTLQAARVQPVAPPAAAVFGGARGFLDFGTRVACRNPVNRAASNWNALANGMTIAEQLAITAEDFGYAVTGGYPKLVNYFTLAPAVPAPGAVPGNFMERLPEFLCQLGGKTKLADFL
ncbi:unnamed protein product [Discula destructiva]